MPPPDPPADLPILVLVVLPVDAPAPDPVPVQTAAVAPDALPETGSQLPLIGMLGVLALMSGLALRAVRVLG